MPKVYDGTPSYHFRVVLDSLDTQSGNIVPFLVLADDDLAAEKDFEDWKNENVLKTDVAGHFYLRLFVHDDGCVIDWKECPSMYEYIGRSCVFVVVEEPLRKREGDEYQLIIIVNLINGKRAGDKCVLMP